MKVLQKNRETILELSADKFGLEDIILIMMGHERKVEFEVGSVGMFVGRIIAAKLCEDPFDGSSKFSLTVRVDQIGRLRKERYSGKGDFIFYKGNDYTFQIEWSRHGGFHMTRINWYWK